MIKRFLSFMIITVFVAGLIAPASALAQNTSNSYAALGDSVASGAGLPAAPTANTSVARCGRSAESYPYHVAKTMNLSLKHQACSGATAGDLFTKQRAGSPNLPPQLDAAFPGGTPKLITITAGANDAHWDDFLRACYSRECNTMTSTVIADAYLEVLKLKLYYLFYDIQARSGSQPPKVIMTGYYNPLSSACASTQTQVTSGEITWLTKELQKLNQVVKTVSKDFSFVTYVPVSFAGHDMCSSKPWIQGLTDPAPFHPNALGQQAIAKAVLSAARKTK